ncbi:hypothetical protein [Streptomyces sp. KL118A]|uniref:hypothetical protein n=1 Tax=Streptomyces sp. KL118A TaxID=3045153 RepID=UPI00278C2AB7|nr:hypothetical protein [Streptomyces sp. KL118A]
MQWRHLPHNFPHRNTDYGYFAHWQKGGICAQLNGLLRELAREHHDRPDGPPPHRREHHLVA